MHLLHTAPLFLISCCLAVACASSGASESPPNAVNMARSEVVPPQEQPVDAAAAEELFQHGEWAKAAAAYEQITQADPKNGMAWMRLGYSRHMLGRFEPAIAAYEKVEGQRGAPTARYNIACAYARLGRRDPALDALEKALAMGFNDVQTLTTDDDLASLRGDARFAELVAKARSATPAPYTPPPEARQFDFWIGEWEVKTPNGNVAGKSRIEKILNGCVILENWTDSRGGSGKSFNTYDPKAKLWRQHWVDDSGDETYFTGRFESGRLTFRADKETPDGKPLLRQMSFFDLGEDGVRQLGEASTDGGKSWKTEYDLVYRKR